MYLQHTVTFLVVWTSQQMTDRRERLRVSLPNRPWNPKIPIRQGKWILLRLIGRNLLRRWSRTLLLSRVALLSRVTFLHLRILEQEYSVSQSNLGSEHDSLASLRPIPPGHSAVPLSRPLSLCLRTRLVLPVNQPKKSCKLFRGKGCEVACERKRISGCHVVIFGGINHSGKYVCVRRLVGRGLICKVLIYMGRLFGEFCSFEGQYFF